MTAQPAYEHDEHERTVWERLPVDGGAAELLAVVDLEGQPSPALRGALLRLVVAGRVRTWRDRDVDMVARGKVAVLARPGQALLFATAANTVADRDAATKRARLVLFADASPKKSQAASEGRGYARLMLGERATSPASSNDGELSMLAAAEVSRCDWLNLPGDVRAAVVELYGHALTPHKMLADGTWVPRELTDVERRAVKVAIGWVEHGPQPTDGDVP